SIQALKADGEIRVAVCAQGDMLSISVTDTGMGIPEHVLPQLGKAGMSIGKEGGTGFGLHFAKQLAESQGGSLVLSSKVGQKTTVTMTLSIATDVKSC